MGPSQVDKLTRAAEIAHELARRSESGMRASHVAALATRRAKDYGVGTDTLETRWAETGRAVGFGPQHIAPLLDRAVVVDLASTERAAMFDELASPNGLTARASTYGRRDIVMALADRLPTGAPVRKLEAMADAYLASDRAVLLADPLLARTSANALRLRHGTCASARLAGVERDEARYSTPELLAVEQRVLATAIDGRGSGRGVAEAGALERALARRPSLSDEQRAMVAALTTSGDAVEVVAAAAGSGKTYALDAAREAWQSSGIRVLGAGLAARYAAELEAGAGIESYTLDRLLSEFRFGIDAPHKPVFVVDEANTVGTRKLAALLDIATEREGKVVLVGDPHQLCEIDAGGAFRALSERLGAHALTENFRQRHQWERAALGDLRTGDVERALAAYASHGAVVAAETAGAVRSRLVSDYLAARGQGSVAMSAPRRADAEDLNRRARAQLFERGELVGPEVRIAGRGFALGDVVMATRNDYGLGVMNGTRGVVTAIDAEAQTLAIRTDAGTDVTLPTHYLEAGHLAHAYATTAHKVEGMTVDRAFFLGDPSVCREMGYVAMSRGRESNHFYVVTPEQPVRLERFGDANAELLSELARGLGRSATKSLAVDTAGEAGLAARPFRELVAERDALFKRLADGAPPDPRERRNGVEELRRRCAEGLRLVTEAQAHLDSLPRRERKRLAAEGRLVTPPVRDWSARLAECDQQLAALQRQGQRRAAYFEANHTDVDRYRLLNRVIEGREGRAVSRVAMSPPSYITAALGSRPEGPRAREAWTAGVAVIERHRLRHGIADAQRPLGPEPSRQSRDYSTWREATRQLRLASEHLERAGVAHALARARVAERGIGLHIGR